MNPDEAIDPQEEILELQETVDGIAEAVKSHAAAISNLAVTSRVLSAILDLTEENRALRGRNEQLTSLAKQLTDRGQGAPGADT